MKNKTLRRAVLFGALILLTGLIGQPTAHGYLHAADPFVLLAAVYLPLPFALPAAALGGMLADLLKGYPALALPTLLIRVLMVCAVKGLLKTSPARRHPELAALPAALIPVAGYYGAELIFTRSFSAAAGTLQKDLLQAGGSILLFIFFYDLAEGVRAARRNKHKEDAEQ